MKRYLAFCGNYCAFGGMFDFIGDFDVLSEAIQAIESKTKSYCWAHVWDCETRIYVYKK